jgi:hypothetical protein
MSKKHRECGTCRFYGPNGAGELGYCLWAHAMPPALTQLLSALEAEQGLRIAYSVFKGMEVSVGVAEVCSAWQGSKP